jgi:hypothetical protein
MSATVTGLAMRHRLSLLSNILDDRNARKHILPRAVPSQSKHVIAVKGSLIADESELRPGDFIYNNNHTYMNDGSILRWLSNLDRYLPVLKNFKTYYVGHGSPCDCASLAKQKEYFLTYCSNVLKATGDTGIFTDDTRKSFEQIMLSMFPDYGCQFMVALSADQVGRELVSLSH